MSLKSREAYKEPCPKCGAEAGQLCFASTSRKNRASFMSRPHRERIKK
jgi:hypothetical protein